MKRIVSPVLMLCLLYISGTAQPLKITNLRCEDAANPQGIDVIVPRLSWQFQSGKRNVSQSAFRVLAASSLQLLQKNTGDVWDSEKQSSDQSVLISYDGKPLKSRQVIYWKVKVWTNKGEEAWSEPATWSMGLLCTTDWEAKWIGYDNVFSAWEKPDDHFTNISARYCRKEFTTKRQIEKAVLYVSGVGLYELYINGKKAGRDVLAPGPTDYAKRVFYNTFEVTELIKKGKNALSVILGSGRFVPLRQHLEDTTNNCVNYGFPKLLMQLEMVFTDGSSKKILSDSSWKISGDGPITANNEFDGETYDARKEFAGWDLPGFFADDRWRPVQLVSPAAPVIQSQLNPPIRITETITPKSIANPKPGVYVFDMEQNMVGWVQLKVKGAKGTKIQLRFAERVNEDGTVYTENLGDAKSTDLYILNGKGIEVWQPRFVYHGFRFVEVTGFPGTPALNAVEGKVVHDDLELIGNITTSNEVLNKVYHNMYWGIRGNYRGMPTDCPQRDERMGWLGDRVAVGLGESFMFNIHNFYIKWMQDIEDSQHEDGALPDVAPAYWRMYTDNTTWPAAYVYNIKMLYDQYGDARPAKMHYESIKRWLAYLRKNFMKDGIITENTYGDWCVPPETLTQIHSQDPNRRTPGEYLSTAFYYDILNIMQSFAVITGNKGDTSFYKDEAEKMYNAFNKKFFNAEKNCYANNTATANILALAFNLVPAGVRKAVFEQVVDKTMNEGKGHITTGLVGIQQLMRTLTYNNRSDIAYLLATQTSYPGWGYMLTQGATTIWELWNGNTANPAMNSANHVMMIGDLLTWYYENLGGIKAAAPAFKTIIMKPISANALKYVCASYKAPHGLIKSCWKKEKNVFTWDVEVPANSNALVYIPSERNDSIMENNIAVNSESDIQTVGYDVGYTLLKIGSGKYHFIVR